MPAWFPSPESVTTVVFRVNPLEVSRSLVSRS